MALEQAAPVNNIDVEITSTWGQKRRLSLPSAVVEELKKAAAEGAVIGITSYPRFTGKRLYARVQPIHVLHQPGKPPYLVYAGFGLKVPKKHPPAKKPRPAIPGLGAAYDALYLPIEDAVKILAVCQVKVPACGTAVSLPTGATLLWLDDPRVRHPWYLRGAASAVAATLVVGKLGRPAQGPGPGQFQYAVVMVAPHPDGRHQMRPTNNLRYAAKIVRRLARIQHRAEILEGLFSRGQHWLQHQEYLQLIPVGEGKLG
jgi:hypothetical protein